MAFYANAVFNQLNAEMFGFYMHSNELAKIYFYTNHKVQCSFSTIQIMMILVLKHMNRDVHIDQREKRFYT